MKRLIASAAIAALTTAPVHAQLEQDLHTATPADPAVTGPKETVAEEIVPEPMALEPLMLKDRTPIKLAVAKEVNSSTHDAGDIFGLTVLEDVRVGDTVVIPSGTPASAEITWRTGKGAFGKSGKLEFAMRSVELNGQSIPVTGSFRQEGEGNTVATGVGVLAIGVFAGFITGKRARLPVGRELLSQVAQPVEFTPDGVLSASFDSDGAMAAAFADSPLGQCKTEAETLAKPKKREKRSRNAIKNAWNKWRIAAPCAGRRCRKAAWSLAMIVVG
ncbi:MAG: hypothetical protein ABJP02_03940 [Parasphingorhabdus sp.]|uniref:hypothetical protein n=1 Tax=Parasphingorhabdus sp. TaxID=2709688 RepID=UPI003296C4E4